MADRTHDKFIRLTPEIYAYLCAHRSERDGVLAELVAETATLGGISRMQIAPEQGALLTLFARLTNAKRAVEVGTFTGYSAISIARGLAPGGRLLCCDISEEWTGIARKYWQRAGVADKIDLRIGPAIETLKTLPASPTIDLAFIDADKTSYRDYYEALLPKLSPRGVIVFDNVLWGGSVVDRDKQDESTTAIRALNDFVAKDDRVHKVMLPVADGITLVRRR